MQRMPFLQVFLNLTSSLTELQNLIYFIARCIVLKTAIDVKLNFSETQFKLKSHINFLKANKFTFMNI
jgi:hypothetical protein